MILYYIIYYIIYVLFVLLFCRLRRCVRGRRCEVAVRAGRAVRVWKVGGLGVEGGVEWDGEWEGELI